MEAPGLFTSDLVLLPQVQAEIFTLQLVPVTAASADN
jgi:hypothetical protein